MSDNLLEKASLDDVLAKFSVWGRYHAVSLLWLTIALLCETICYSNFVFIAEEVRYKCAEDNSTYNNASESFSLNHAQIAKSGWCDAPAQCTQWIYDNPHSFVAEFQLACQEWKRTLVGTAHISGYMVGIFIVGSLSDRFGRRSIIIITGLIAAACGFLKSFVNVYWLYIGIEFFEGALGDPYSPIYMLILETVATASRPTYTSTSNIGLVLGGVSLALIKWLVPYWRTYTRVIYAPMVMYILLIYLVDESPRWLLTKGKMNEVVNNLEKAANLNKIEIKDSLSALSYEEDTKADFTTVIVKTFKSKTLLKRFFICVIWWNASTFVDHGLSLNSVLLEGNRNLNYGMVCSMRLPAAFIAACILNKFKRKGPLMMSYVACTVLLACQPFIPKNQLWLGIVLYLASKIASGMSYNITYIFTSELFPTYTRNSMHALCSSLGRFGNIAATQIPLLVAYWSGLPIVVFGTATLVGALVTLLVPDPAEAPLPDTVRQAEALDSYEVKSLVKDGSDQRKRTSSVGFD